MPATMPAEKRNHFLDADDSNDDIDRPDDSDNDLQKGGRDAKRRKVVDDQSDVEDRSDDEREEGQTNEDNGEGVDAAEQNKGGDAANGPTHETPEKKSSKPKSGLKRELPCVTKTSGRPNLVITEAAIRKSGVVYISRVPPYMNPHKLRSLLQPYGKLNRVFLQQEESAVRAQRIKGGGNKKRSFTEGWVEFVRKKDAKKACELLNVGHEDRTHMSVAANPDRFRPRRSVGRKGHTIATTFGVCCIFLALSGTI